MAQVNRMQQEIEMLRGMSAPCQGGTTRLSYTPACRQAMDYLRQRMEEAGLQVSEDGLGMLHGVLPGTNPQLPPILSGSHVDTVRCGGSFDGQAGVICALEAARMIRESGRPLARNFEVVATLMEEGARYPSLAGSCFTVGRFGRADLERLTDGDGITLGQALAEYGLGNDLADVCRSGQPAKAFLEVHIEQGSKLERAGMDFGIVQTIYGDIWLKLTCLGAGAHPSSPLDVRKDAGLATCKLITDVANHVAEQYSGRAAVTAGRIAFYPGETNAVPYRTEFTLDFRGRNQEDLDALYQMTLETMERVGREYRVSFAEERITDQRPVPMEPTLAKHLEESARSLGHSTMEMDSGAGHDSMILGQIWPVAMLFLPCKEGLTHCPQEWCEYEAMAKGADVLCEALRRIDAE